MSVSESSAWKNLVAHRKSLSQNVIDPNDVRRLHDCTLELDGLRFVYAFQQTTDQTHKLLLELAEYSQVENWRSRMFAGEKINGTEKRAVLHTALRRKDETPLLVDGTDILPEIKAAQSRIKSLVEDVREGKRVGYSGKRFRQIINIGIGGSDLGPRLAVEALAPLAEKFDVHFVANVDASELETVLSKVNADECLFVVVSKTFTTQETLLNAQRARGWVIEKLGAGAVAKHFVAVSVNKEAVELFGIDPSNMYPMWDWVGGRFSVWSAVGMSVALAIGYDNFEAFLSGAARMDAHFQSAPLAKNIPVMMALLGIWNRNFLNAGSLAVLPYCERLRSLPRFLQQLEMESNGKSVTRSGAPVSCETAPVIFGDCGTVSQHSFHQWLHQGSSKIPNDIISVLHDDYNEPAHYRSLITNLVGQVGAFSFGQPQASAPQDIYSGARASNLIFLDRLDPYHLGLLLALYEHKTFVQGIVWDINSFDQPGVELGKRLAKKLETIAEKGDDASSEAPIITALFVKVFPQNGNN